MCKVERKKESIAAIQKEMFKALQDLVTVDVIKYCCHIYI
jgi:hypothetical protein